MSDQFPDLGVTAPTVSARELKARLDGGESVTLLDTRRPGDFAAWHIDHPNLEAVNVPFTRFLDGDDPVEELPAGVPDGPVVTCCAKGISSQFVAEVLARAGRDVAGLADGMEGWARLLETFVVADDPTVVQCHRPSSGCLGYVVVDGGEAAVVDPLRAFAGEYAAVAREHDATVRHAVDTHVHADHVSGVRDAAAATGAGVVLPAGAEARGLAFDRPYRLIEDGDDLPLGGTALSAVHAPGHTSEMTLLRAGDVLLTADTLFLDGVGRPDLEAGEAGAADLARTLHASLQRVLELPDDTVVAPGHASRAGQPGAAYVARLGDLADELSVLSLDREAFVERVLADVPPRPDNFREIIDVNLGRGSVDDAAAFELELGPNNCAAAAD